MCKVLILFLIFKVTSCQRRITNSSSVDYRADTSFMVYIVAAKTTDSDPGWLCGGSIIHPSLVLTSASCLQIGTQQMYVITGYRKYVRTERLDEDICTRRMKKRIVSYCVHGYYADGEGWNNSDERKYKWLKFDIGIARTETPIDFYDADYPKYCSYRPNFIRTHYNSRYESTGNQVVIYGWGHAVFFRPEGDTTDYNEKYLRYTSSIIISRDTCHNFFSSSYIKDRVKKHFICVDGQGYFNDQGKYQATKAPAKSICRRSYGNYTGMSVNSTSCFENSFNETSSSNDTLQVAAETTRRNGICQNDHGVPMVRWIGGHPFVIGVASAFRVNKKMQCVGPYLFSSVLCTSLFINCILQEQNRRTASKCDESKSYNMKEVEIDWSDQDF